MRRTIAKLAVCPLVEQQCRLQVARRGDFLCTAIGARRVALVATLDPLALNIVAAMRTLGVCVEYRPFSHDSFLAAAAVHMRNVKLESFGGPRNFRQGLTALAPVVDWLRFAAERHPSLHHPSLHPGMHLRVSNEAEIISLNAD
jgi:hypothetical protein